MIGFRISFPTPKTTLPWEDDLMKRALLAFALLLAPTALHAEPQKAAPQPAPVLPEFELLKGLVGEWKAVGEGAQSSTSFELLSNGSALVERLKPGPDETMVNVYVADGGAVVMTHYCAAGNQPRYRGSKKDSGLAFTMTDITGWEKGEPRMSAVTITMPDADHMNEEWTTEMNGKSESFTIAFERKK